MLSLEHLPALALLALAAAALAAGVLGGLLPQRAAIAGRVLVRLGLLATLGILVDLVAVLQPAGSVAVVLWRIAPTLPVELQVDVAGAAVAIAATTAALLVSLSGRDGALASAAIGVAALGAILASLSGGLLSLYIGLQLSAVGGIGLSYARSPRAPSGRMVVAAVADQAVTLLWLGAVVGLNRQTGTMLFSGIPTAAVTLPLAGILLIPGVVRLVGAGLVPDAASSAGTAHALDLADWLAVVAVPTGLTVLLRVQQLSGGTWPNPALGTGLDGLAVILGLGAALLVVRGGTGAGLRPLLLVSGAMVLLGFGANSAPGTGLAVAAALFLELGVLVAPRLLIAAPSTSAERPLPAWGGQAALVAATAPLSLGVTVAVVGIALALAAGPGAGLLPGLGYGVSLAVLALAWARLRRVRVQPLPWPLALPALGLALAAALPGGVLAWVAAPIANPGGAGLLPLTTPDPLSVQLPGLLWPAGYLAVIVVLLGSGLWAFNVIFDRPPPEFEAVVPASPPAAAIGWVRGARAFRVTLRTARAVRLGLGISSRELAERPVWMWLAATLTVAWLLVQR